MEHLRNDQINVAVLPEALLSEDRWERNALYEEDFKKIDASGRISALYHSIPAQLAKDSRKYRITTAIGKRGNTKADELLYELMDSKTILSCYNSTDLSLIYDLLPAQ